jgi:hypothetical protein
VDTSEKISGEFGVACGNGSKVLEFVEEALCEIALAIEGTIVESSIMYLAGLPF